MTGDELIGSPLPVLTALPGQNGSPDGLRKGFKERASFAQCCTMLPPLTSGSKAAREKQHAGQRGKMPKNAYQREKMMEVMNDEDERERDI